MFKSILFWALAIALLVPANAMGQQVRPDALTLQVPADTIVSDTLMTDTLVLDSVAVLHPLHWENVHQDSRIHWLLMARREQARRALGIPGFRVHLFEDSGNMARINTQRAMADFLELYPEVRAYVVYEEPYFKLRVGDFRARLDARRFLETIRADYSSAHIVVDRINFPD